jgi:hypothetical protein
LLTKFSSLRNSSCVKQWRDKLQLGVFGFYKQELALPVRYQAELGNEGKMHRSALRTVHLSNKPEQSTVIPAGFWPESSL